MPIRMLGPDGQVYDVEEQNVSQAVAMGGDFYDANDNFQFFNPSDGTVSKVNKAGIRNAISAGMRPVARPADKTVRMVGSDMRQYDVKPDMLSQAFSMGGQLVLKPDSLLINPNDPLTWPEQEGKDNTGKKSTDLTRPKNLGDAFAEVLDRPLSYLPYLNFVDVFEATKQYKAAKAAQAGTITPEQEEYLNAVTADQQRDRTLGYKIADIVLRMPAYALEFMTAGGAIKGLSKRALIKASQGKLKNITENQAVSLAKSLGVKETENFAEQLGKIKAAKSIQDLTSVAVDAAGPAGFVNAKKLSQQAVAAVSNLDLFDTPSNAGTAVAQFFLKDTVGDVMKAAGRVGADRRAFLAARKAGKDLTKFGPAGITEATTEEMKKALGSSLAAAAAYGLGPRTAVFSSGRVANLTVANMTPVFGLQADDQGNMKRVLAKEGDDFWPAFAKAYGDMAIENISESVGENFLFLKGFFGDQAKDAFKAAWTSTHLNALSNKLRDAAPATVSDAAAWGKRTAVNFLFGKNGEPGALEKLGYNGYFAELGEEAVGGVLRQMFGISPVGLPSLEDVAAMAVGFAINPLAIGGMAYESANQLIAESTSKVMDKVKSGDAFRSAEELKPIADEIRAVAEKFSRRPTGRFDSVVNSLFRLPYARAQARAIGRAFQPGAEGKTIAEEIGMVPEEEKKFFSPGLDVRNTMLRIEQLGNVLRRMREEKGADISSKEVLSDAKIATLLHQDFGVNFAGAEVSPEVLDNLNQLVKKGIVFAPSSGRFFDPHMRAGRDRVAIRGENSVSPVSDEDFKTILTAFPYFADVVDLTKPAKDPESGEDMPVNLEASVRRLITVGSATSEDDLLRQFLGDKEYQNLPGADKGDARFDMNNKKLVSLVGSVLYPETLAGSEEQAQTDTDYAKGVADSFYNFLNVVRLMPSDMPLSIGSTFFAEGTEKDFKEALGRGYSNLQKVFKPVRKTETGEDVFRVMVNGLNLAPQERKYSEIFLTTASSRFPFVKDKDGMIIKNARGLPNQKNSTLAHEVMENILRLPGADVVAEKANELRAVYQSLVQDETLSGTEKQMAQRVLDLFSGNDTELLVHQLEVSLGLTTVNSSGSMALPMAALASKVSLPSGFKTLFDTLIKGKEGVENPVWSVENLEALLTAVGSTVSLADLENGGVITPVEPASATQEEEEEEDGGQEPAKKTKPAKKTTSVKKSQEQIIQEAAVASGTREVTLPDWEKIREEKQTKGASKEMLATIDKIKQEQEKYSEIRSDENFYYAKEKASGNWKRLIRTTTAASEAVGFTTTPQKEAAILGTTFHAIVSDILDGRTTEEIIESRSPRIVVDKEQKIDPERAKKDSEVIDRLREELKQKMPGFSFSPGDWLTEVFVADVDNYGIAGTVDAIYWNEKENKFYVLDWKTMLAMPWDPTKKDVSKIDSVSKKLNDLKNNTSVESRDVLASKDKTQDDRQANKFRLQVSSYSDLLVSLKLIADSKLSKTAYIVPVSRTNKTIEDSTIQDLRADRAPIEINRVKGALEHIADEYYKANPLAADVSSLPSQPALLDETTVRRLSPESFDPSKNKDKKGIWRSPEGAPIVLLKSDSGPLADPSVYPLFPREGEIKPFTGLSSNWSEFGEVDDEGQPTFDSLTVSQLPQSAITINNAGDNNLSGVSISQEGAQKKLNASLKVLSYTTDEAGAPIIKVEAINYVVKDFAFAPSLIIPEAGFILQHGSKYLFIPGNTDIEEAKRLATLFVGDKATGLKPFSLGGKVGKLEVLPKKTRRKSTGRRRESKQSKVEAKAQTPLEALQAQTGLLAVYNQWLEQNPKATEKEKENLAVNIVKGSANVDRIKDKKVLLRSLLNEMAKGKPGAQGQLSGGSFSSSEPEGLPEGVTPEQVEKAVQDALARIDSVQDVPDFDKVFIRGALSSKRYDLAYSVANLLLTEGEIDQAKIREVYEVVFNFNFDQSTGSVETNPIRRINDGRDALGEDQLDDSTDLSDETAGMEIDGYVPTEAEERGRKVFGAIAKSLGMSTDSWWKVYSFFQDPIARDILRGVSVDQETGERDEISEDEMMELLGDENLFQEEFSSNLYPEVRRQVYDLLTRLKKKGRERGVNVDLRQAWLTSVLSYSQQNLLPMNKIGFSYGKPTKVTPISADIIKQSTNKLTVKIETEMSTPDSAVKFLNSFIGEDNDSYLVRFSRAKFKSGDKLSSQKSAGQTYENDFYFEEEDEKGNKTLKQVDWDQAVSEVSKLTGISRGVLYAGFGYDGEWHRNFHGSVSSVIRRVQNLFKRDKNGIAQYQNLDLGLLQSEYIGLFSSTTTISNQTFPSFLVQVNTGVDLSRVPTKYYEEAESELGSLYFYRSARGRRKTGLRARMWLADSLDEMGREWRVVDFAEGYRTSTFGTNNFDESTIALINEASYSEDPNADYYWQYYGRLGDNSMVVQVKVNKPDSLAQLKEMRNEAARILKESGYVEKDLDRLIPSTRYINTIKETSRGDLRHKEGTPEWRRVYDAVYALNVAILQTSTAGSPFSTIAGQELTEEQKIKKETSFPKRLKSSTTPGYPPILDIEGGLGPQYNEIIVAVSDEVLKKLFPNLDGFDLLVNDGKWRKSFGDMIALNSGVEAENKTASEGRWAAMKPIQVGRDELRKASTGLLEFLARTQPNSLYSALSEILGLGKGEAIVDFVRLRSSAKLLAKDAKVIELTDLVDVNPNTTEITPKKGAIGIIKKNINQLDSKGFRIILEQRSTTTAKPDQAPVQLISSLITEGNTDVVDALEEVRSVLLEQFSSILTDSVIGQDGKINLIYLRRIAEDHLHNSEAGSMIAKLIEENGARADLRLLSPTVWARLESALRTFTQEYSARMIVNSVYMINTPSGRAVDPSLTTEVGVEYDPATGRYITLDRQAEDYADRLMGQDVEMRAARVFTNIVNGRNFETIEQLYSSDLEARVAAGLRILEQRSKYVDMFKPGMYATGLRGVITESEISKAISEIKGLMNVSMEGGTAIAPNFVAAHNRLREFLHMQELDVEQTGRGYQVTIPSQPVFWMRIPASSGAATGYGRISRNIVGGEAQLIMSYEDSEKAGADHDGDKWFVYTVTTDRFGNIILEERIGDASAMLGSNSEALGNQSFMRLLDHFYENKDTHLERYTPISTSRFDDIVAEEEELEKRSGGRKPAPADLWLFGPKKQLENVKESRAGLSVRGIFAANLRVYKTLARKKNYSISQTYFKRIVKRAPLKEEEPWYFEEEGNWSQEGYTIKKEGGNLIFEFNPTEKQDPKHLPGMRKGWDKTEVATRPFRLVFGVSDRLDLSKAPAVIDSLLQLAVDNETERKLSRLGITGANASYVTALLLLNPELHTTGTTEQQYLDYLREIVKFLKNQRVAEYFKILDSRFSPDGRTRFNELRERDAFAVYQNAFNEPFFRDTPEALRFVLKFLAGQTSSEMHSLYRLLNAGRVRYLNNLEVEEAQANFEMARRGNDIDRERYYLRQNIRSTEAGQRESQTVPADQTEDGKPYLVFENREDHEARVVKDLLDKRGKGREVSHPVVIHVRNPGDTIEKEKSARKGIDESDATFVYFDLVRDSEGRVTDEAFQENVNRFQKILDDLNETGGVRMSSFGDLTVPTLVMFGDSGISGFDELEETAPETFYQIRKMLGSMLDNRVGYKMLNTSSLFENSDRTLSGEGGNLRRSIEFLGVAGAHSVAATRVGRGLLSLANLEIEKERGFQSSSEKQKRKGWAEKRIETILRVQGLSDSYYLADSADANEAQKNSTNSKLIVQLAELQKKYPGHPLYSSLRVNDKSGKRDKQSFDRSLVVLIPTLSMDNGGQRKDEVREQVRNAIIYNQVDGKTVDPVPVEFLQNLYAASLLEFGADASNADISYSPLGILPLEVEQMFANGEWAEMDAWMQGSLKYEKFLWETYSGYILRKTFLPGLSYAEPAVGHRPKRLEQEPATGSRTPRGMSTAMPEVPNHEVQEGQPRNILELSTSSGYSLSSLVTMAQGANRASQPEGVQGVKTNGIQMYGLSFEYLPEIENDEQATALAGKEPLDGTGTETYDGTSEYTYKTVQGSPFGYPSFGMQVRPATVNEAVENGQKTMLVWAPGTKQRRPVPVWLDETTPEGKRTTYQPLAKAGDIIKVDLGEGKIGYLRVTQDPINLEYLAVDLIGYKVPGGLYANIASLPTAEGAGKYTQLMPNKLKYIPGDLRGLPKSSTGNPVSISLLMSGAVMPATYSLASNDKFATVLYTGLVNTPSENSTVDQTLRETPEEIESRKEMGVKFHITEDLLKEIDERAEAVLVFGGEAQMERFVSRKKTDAKNNREKRLKWLIDLVAGKDVRRTMEAREAVAAVKAAVDAAQVSSSAFLFAGEGVITQGAAKRFALGKAGNVQSIMHAVGLFLANSNTFDNVPIKVYVFDETSNQWYKMPLFSNGTLEPVAVEQVNLEGNHLLMSSGKAGNNSDAAAAALFDKYEAPPPGGRAQAQLSLPAAFTAAALALAPATLPAQLSRTPANVLSLPTEVSYQDTPSLLRPAFDRTEEYITTNLLDAVRTTDEKDVRSAVNRLINEIMMNPRVIKKLNVKTTKIKFVRTSEEFERIVASHPEFQGKPEDPVAFYSAKADTIYLKGPVFSRYKLSAQKQTILHEMLHDYMQKLINQDKRLNQQINYLREAVKKANPSLMEDKSFKYYLNDSHEFVSGFANEAFVQELRKLQFSETRKQENAFTEAINFIANGFAKITNTKNQRAINAYEYAIESVINAIDRYSVTEEAMRSLEAWPENFEPKKQQEESIAFGLNRSIAPLEKTVFEITKGDKTNLTQEESLRLRRAFVEIDKMQTDGYDLFMFEERMKELGYNDTQTREIVRVAATEVEDGKINVGASGIHSEFTIYNGDPLVSTAVSHTIPEYVKEVLSSDAGPQAQISALTSWVNPRNPFISGAEQDTVFESNRELSQIIMSVLYQEQNEHLQALEILGVNGDYIRRMTKDELGNPVTNAIIFRAKNKFALKGKVTDEDLIVYNDFAAAISELLANSVELEGEDIPGVAFKKDLTTEQLKKKYNIGWGAVISAERTLNSLMESKKSWPELDSYGAVVQGLGAKKLGRIPENMKDLLKPDRELFEAGKKEIWQRLLKETKIIWGRKGTMVPNYKKDEEDKETNEILGYSPREGDEETAESVNKRWKNSKHYKRLINEGGRTDQIISMEYWATRVANNLRKTLDKLNGINEKYMGQKYLVPRMAYAPRSNAGLGVLSPADERFLYARRRDLDTKSITEPVLEHFRKSRYDGGNALRPNSKPTAMQKKIYQSLSGNKGFTGQENESQADEKIFGLLMAELGKEMLAKRNNKTLNPAAEGLNRSIEGIRLDELFKYLQKEIMPIVKSPVNASAQDVRQFNTWAERSRATGELPGSLNIFDLSKEYVGRQFDILRQRLVLTTAITTKDMNGRPEGFLDVDEAFDYMSKRAIVPPSALQTMVDNWLQYLAAEGIEKHNIVANEPLVEQIKKLARILDGVPRGSRNRTQEGLSGYEKFGEGTVPGVRAVYINRGYSANAVKMVIDQPWSKEINILGREIDVAKAAMDLSQGTKMSAVAFSAFFPLAGIEQQIGYWGQFKQFWTKPLSFLGSGKFKLPEGVDVQGYVGFVKALFNRNDADINRLVSDFTRMGLVLDLSKNSDVMLAEIENMSKRFANWVRIEGKPAQRALIPVETIFKAQAKYTKFLFGEFFPMLKMHSAYLIYKRAENEHLEIFGKPWSEHHRMETIGWIAQQMNDGFGGQNWSSYKFATPKMMQTMNLGFFAFNWTMSTANTFGLNKILEKLGLGPEVKSPQIRQMVLANSLMLGTALLLWPQLLQAMIYASFGDPDEKDKLFTLQNEQGKMLHVDFTPIMRKLPWYTGDDTGKRRYYMRWGKQMYEVVDGWLTDAERTFFSKMSLPAQFLMQQITGRQPGSDFAMPFKDGGLLGLFWTREEGVLGSRAAHALSMFLPFSLQALSGSTSEAFLAGTFASVSKGKSKGMALDELTKVFVTYGWPSVWPGLNNKPQGQENLRALAYGIVDAAQRNGFPTKDLIDDARARALGKLYRGAIEALNDGDFDEFDGFARGIMRINGTAAGLMRSIESGEVSFGKLKVEMTPEVMEAIRQSFSQ